MFSDVKLSKVTIAGYRSIREPLELIVEDAVTVVLGANDHGKTNLLEALRHLNPDHAYASEDVNWDLDPDSAKFPAIAYELRLTDEEREELARLDTASRRLIAAQTARDEVEESLSELETNADEARQAAKSAIDAVTSAQAAYDAAKSAAGGDPQNEELKNQLSGALAALKEAQRESSTREDQRVVAEGFLEGARLTRDLSRARSVEAQALADDRLTPSLVARPCR